MRLSKQRRTPAHACRDAISARSSRLSSTRASSLAGCAEMFSSTLSHCKHAACNHAGHGHMSASRALPHMEAWGCGYGKQCEGLYRRYGVQVSVEAALRVVFQPQAIFRVRPVARCTASMPGAPILPQRCQGNASRSFCDPLYRIQRAGVRSTYTAIDRPRHLWTSFSASRPWKGFTQIVLCFKEPCGSKQAFPPFLLLRWSVTSLQSRLLVCSGVRH